VARATSSKPLSNYASANAGRGFSFARVPPWHLGQHQPNINPERTIAAMNEESKRFTNEEDIPASLRRKKKEPSKMVALRIPLSWWEELSALAREFDQDVSTFLREATEDWLRRARKVQQKQTTTR
jgi:hypothetical protein